MSNILKFRSRKMPVVTDTLKQYTEFMLEYDNDDNLVYISGLTKDGTWDEISVQDDIAEPESYAWGFSDALKLNGIFSTVTAVDYED